MILPDVNVLIHAYNSDSPQHKACRDWLDLVVNGDGPYGMSPQVLSSVVRIATNPRVFPGSSRHPVSRVLEYCEALLAPEPCQVVFPGPRHWPIFSRLCLECDVRGDLVSDAWFAALAIEHACEWVTLDRDFARFRELRWRTPF